jgi:neurotransmitter:Na+ symporter, NSS family
MAKESKDGWSSRIGVIMAVAGSAVGLGNFLRFPGKAYDNGGGAFMIPYFVALLLLGIPLCWAEWSMGRYGGRKGFNSGPGIFTVLWRHPLAKYFGTMTVIIPLCVYFYYIVIEAWCLSYAWSYLTGALMQGNDTAVYQNHFLAVTGEGQDGVLFGFHSNTLVCLLITFLLNYVVVFRGLSGGIEKFCNVAMPLMALCAIFVLVRVLTLGTPNPELPDQNVLNGLGKMWNPPERLSDTLTNPKAWLAAAGQIFFTLSVGFGVIIHYASYLKKNDDVALSGITASAVNETFEVCLGGLITITAAFIFLGAGFAQYTSSSFSLGFNALPNVFANMPGGQFFGFVWFFMLFLAAITSSLSMLQPVNAFFKEAMGWNQAKSTAFLFALTLVGTGYVVYFSQGLRALDAIDFWAGEFFIVVLAIIQAIFYGWVLGVEKGKEELDRGALLKVPGFVQWILKYVTPVFLLVLLVANFIPPDANTPSNIMKRLGQASDPVVGGALGIVIGAIVICAVIATIGEKRWKASGRYAEQHPDH